MTDDLIRHARAVLAGEVPVESSHRGRLAAVLLRQALEDEIETRCAERGHALPHPVTMRSRLIVLRALRDNMIDRIDSAWIALSNACHHHAYELSPTVGEVRHLMEVVQQLSAMRKP